MTKKIVCALAALLMSLALGVMIMMADGIYSPVHHDFMVIIMIMVIFVSGYVLIDVIY